MSKTALRRLRLLLNESNSSDANILNFYSVNSSVQGHSRECGFTVRPVCDKLSVEVCKIISCRNYNNKTEL